MIYWSMQYNGGADVIYYAYANRDFTDLEGEPKPLLSPRTRNRALTAISSLKTESFICFIN